MPCPYVLMCHVLLALLPSCPSLNREPDDALALHVQPGESGEDQVAGAEIVGAFGRGSAFEAELRRGCRVVQHVALVGDRAGIGAGAAENELQRPGHVSLVLIGRCVLVRVGAERRGRRRIRGDRLQHPIGGDDAGGVAGAVDEEATGAGGIPEDQGVWRLVGAVALGGKEGAIAECLDSKEGTFLTLTGRRLLREAQTATRKSEGGKPAAERGSPRRAGREDLGQNGSVRFGHRVRFS